MTTWTTKVPRQRTDPALKWLLNERAALLGRISRSEQTLNPLRGAWAAAQLHADSLAARAVAVESRHREASEALRALDTVIATSYPNVNPAAGGSIQAWAGKYGQRGNLKKFLLSQVQRAAPGSLATGALMNTVVDHFGLQLNSVRERNTFRRHLRIQLRAAAHLVDELPARGPHAVLHWRWRTQPTLTEVARQVACHESAHALRSEVGGQ